MSTPEDALKARLAMVSTRVGFNSSEDKLPQLNQHIDRCF